MEKKKLEKVKDTLTKTEDELKDLKKVRNLFIVNHSLFQTSLHMGNVILKALDANLIILHFKEVFI